MPKIYPGRETGRGNLLHRQHSPRDDGEEGGATGRMSLFTWWSFVALLVRRLKLKFLLMPIHGAAVIFLSLHLEPSGPSHSPPSIKRHGSACNLASIGVSTKLILSNPRGVNPFAYGKSAVERMQADG